MLYTLNEMPLLQSPDLAPTKGVGAIVDPPRY